MPFLKKRKEKRKYVARLGIEPRTTDLRVRFPTDCATRPGYTVGTWHVYILLCKVLMTYTFRDRFLLTVICCPTYHWSKISREVYISRAQSASDLFTAKTDRRPMIYWTTNHLLARLYFDSNAQETSKGRCVL